MKKKRSEYQNNNKTYEITKTTITIINTNNFSGRTKTEKKKF